MTVYKGQITVDTLAGKPTYIDVTKGVADIVAESGVKEGIVTVISAHTTCAVFSEEYDHDTTPTGDTFLQADLSDGLNKIFPEQHDWKTYRYPGPGSLRGGRVLAERGVLPAWWRSHHAMERRRPPALHHRRWQPDLRGCRRQAPDERPGQHLLR